MFDPAETFKHWSVRLWTCAELWPVKNWWFHNSQTESWVLMSADIIIIIAIDTSLITNDYSNVHGLPILRLPHTCEHLPFRRSSCLWTLLVPLCCCQLIALWRVKSGEKHVFDVRKRLPLGAGALRSSPSGALLLTYVSTLIWWPFRPSNRSQ